VPSPCIGVCELDAAGRVCIGCFRTIGEIRRWPDADDAEKLAIRDAAARRARQGALGPARGK
jgi:predicted Fe-S protein YdhL (DUF1289 family)